MAAPTVGQSQAVMWGGAYRGIDGSGGGAHDWATTSEAAPQESAGGPND
jgi:hypothetical protein